MYTFIYLIITSVATQKELKEEFIQLKGLCIEALLRGRITVKDVIEVLSIESDTNPKNILDNVHKNELLQASDHYELMGRLSFNMDYLSYDLLDYLVEKFNLDVDMKKYESKLCSFLENTSLTFFCKTHKIKRMMFSSFREIVVRFGWPENTQKMLDVIDNFWKNLVFIYKLPKHVIMLAHACKTPFVFTWFVPALVSMHMVSRKHHLSTKLLDEFSVNEIKIAGYQIYLRVSLCCSQKLINLILTNNRLLQ